MATLDIKHFILSHIIWIVVVAALVIGGKTWEAEHDKRVIAEQHLASDEATVKTLQQSIVANNQSIAQLQTQMDQRDKQNATVIAQLVKAKQTAVTPTQQVAVLQTEAKLPEPITRSGNSPDWLLPSADVPVLFASVNAGAIAEANLTTCQGDLVDVKTQSAVKDKTIAADVAIIGQKDDEIKTLKKKPAFWNRVKSGLIKVAIGAVVTAVLIH